MSRCVIIFVIEIKDISFKKIVNANVRKFPKVLILEVLINNSNLYTRDFTICDHIF